ncbi:MAG TPA: hypothetical protein VMV86_03480, partial [Methanosarcinales archaeon]|nr:hypothetical protein [Methanosarcinales archaeon]
RLVKTRMAVISKQTRAIGVELSPQRILIRAKYEVEQMIKQAMASGEYSPYDWLKVEYKPKKVGTSYLMEARALAVDRINRVMEKAKRRKSVKFWA